MEQIELALDRIFDAILAKTPAVVLAIITLIAGVWTVRLILKIVRRRFERRLVDLSLRDFVLSVLKFLLYTMLIISVASMVGIQTTSFVAVLGAVSLSIGLALQGSLSNFAGGVLILVFRPFRVGDYIEGGEEASGTVEKIDILYTSLRNAEGISMFVPNGPLANSVIRNYTDIGSRRAQYYIRIPFEADIQQAREVILEVLSSDKRVLRDPEPEVMVEKLDENAVVLIARSWIDRPNYWGAYYENFEHIKIALDKAGLQAPYPQTEMWIMGDRDKNSPDNT